MGGNFSCSLEASKAVETGQVAGEQGVTGSGRRGIIESGRGGLLAIVGLTMVEDSFVITRDVVMWQGEGEGENGRSKR